MAELLAGQSTRVTLGAFQTLDIDGTCEVCMKSGSPQSFSGYARLGPFPYSMVINIRAITDCVYLNNPDSANDNTYAESARVFAFPFTSEAIQSATDQLYNSGQPGIVVLAGVEYDINQNIRFREGVGYLGVPSAMIFTGDVPDSSFYPKNGTVLKIADGVTAFAANDVDQPTTALNIGERSISSISMENISFVGGFAAIKVGAKREMGCTYSNFRNLYFYNQTGYHFSFENFMHTTWGRIYGRNTLAYGGGGMFFRASLATARLIPGNSQIVDEIYCYTSNVTARSIVFEVDNTVGGEGAQMNEFVITARLQVNRFGPLTPLTISGTTVNGSPDITVSASDLLNLPVGVVVGMTSAPSFLTKDTPYYVVANDGVSKIKISIDRNASVGQNVSSTGAITLRTLGYPGLEIHGLSGIFTYCNFGSFNDIECAGAICPVSIRGANIGCSIGISEMRPSKTIRSEINCYAVGAMQILSSQADISIVQNGSSRASFQFRGAGQSTITGSVTVDPAYNGGTVYSTAAGAHNFTVNKGLVPTGFKTKIVPLGAGQITFVPGSGVTINPVATLKSSAQYKECCLEFVSEDRYNGTETWLLTGNITA